LKGDQQGVKELVEPVAIKAFHFGGLTTNPRNAKHRLTSTLMPESGKTFFDGVCPGEYR
jgi:hypothetical protein